MDNLDTIAAKAFEGYVVRKDLVRQFKGQFPVPTYVVEFLLGRYCASTDDSEIQEGLGIVQKQLSSRAVRAGEEELTKAQARDKGSVKVLDMIRAKLDARNDCYVAELPSLRLSDIRIDDALVKNNDRMLTGGFYAEVDLGYDGAIAQERNGKPFSIESLREIQIAKANILDVLIEGRKSFGFEEWKDFLLRSVGLEPEKLSPRTRDVMLLRMVPFVERNYNLVELGPRGTGKSHLYEQVSPYAHLVSGGKATVAQMFVNNSNGQRGLVCQYDVICFDEIAGISFETKEGVNIMKGYMESGKFSRGSPDKISAEGGIVMVGNFDVDVEHQQRIGHLLGPMPPEMRDDTAFMDRIHSYVPGWDVPKMGPELFTDHFGLVCDFLSSSWRQLRNMTQIKHLRDRVILGGALSGRDINAVNKTASGLLKLTYPDVDADIPDDSIEWAVRLAIESRRRIKEQQKR
ncbi:BREX system Lon protease-like protein BrxL, partial [Opitutales bacterium]|nr:BREX system Lon protease-like protein BrxL [Opitutales bacterium]